MDQERFIIIAGPTASGKSDCAIALAGHLGAEIISADSMMVYRHMDIGTAKPDIKARTAVPHHLIDIRNPDQHFDAAMFREHAESAIMEISQRRRPVLVVGGTGLYLRALERGLVEAPPRDEALRKELSGRADREGSEALYRELASVDPGAAEKISPNDLVRIIRALEIYRATGTAASELRKSHGFSGRSRKSLYLVLDGAREKLRQRIRARVVAMVEAGLVEEVVKIQAMGYGSDLKPMKALNYRHACSYLSGAIDLQQLHWEMERDTWHFARRQMNWFKSEPEVQFVPNDLDELMRRITLFLERSED
ncbi:MAG: tRNA (adenosine(37)-N6)-dimethylallyltransferase MiaA [Pseudomonadota bacterium]